MDVNLQYNNSTVVISDVGAEIKSLMLASGRELIWDGSRNNPGEASHVIFPVAGTFEGGEITLCEKKISMPKWGMLREAAFSSSRIAENDALFTFIADKTTDNTTEEEDENEGVFAPSVKIYHRLFSDMLKIKYVVKNDGEKKFSYSIGAHPLFNCPFEATGDYRLIFQENEGQNAAKPGLALFNGYKRLINGSILELSRNIFINDCLCFDKPLSSSIFLTNDNKTGIRIGWSGFTSVAIRVPPKDDGKKYISVEPWFGFENFTVDNSRTLEPGQTKKFELIIEEVLAD